MSCKNDFFIAKKEIVISIFLCMYFDKGPKQAINLPFKIDRTNSAGKIEEKIIPR
jgi:hypothetical protein